MEATLTNLLIQYLPTIVEILFTILGVILTTKVIPFIKSKVTATQFNDIMNWVSVLVDSAQRLDKSGKLEKFTKKEYVMEQLMAYVSDKKYNFTEGQLDNIRRAAVLALERNSVLIENVTEELSKEE